MFCSDTSPAPIATHFGLRVAEPAKKYMHLSYTSLAAAMRGTIGPLSTL